jgi:hypothetical protein
VRLGEIEQNGDEVAGEQARLDGVEHALARPGEAAEEQHRAAAGGLDDVGDARVLQEQEQELRGVEVVDGDRRRANAVRVGLPGPGDRPKRVLLRYSRDCFVRRGRFSRR